ncbi:MAG: PEP-CTERM sorting domain-containing protein [Acidobacteriia bacterium]|nr:PEP-CTERM sorting domain-containing protein [Terriglobia bacterium]
MKQRIMSVAVAAAFLLALSSAAKADTFSFTVANAGVQPPNASYGTVTLTLVDANTISVSVTMTPGYVAFGSGAGSQMFGFNVAGGSTLTDLTNCTNITGGCPTPSTGVNFDGFGNYEYAVAGGTGSSGGVTSFSFDIVGTFVGGLAAIEIVNPTGTNGGKNPGTYDFAIQLGNATCGTGFAGATSGFTAPNPSSADTSNCGGTTTVPEPGTLTLLGTGLLGLAGLVRRKLSA